MSGESIYEEELREAERRYLIARRAFVEADAKLTRAREQLRAERITPEERRRQLRVVAA